MSLQHKVKVVALLVTLALGVAACQQEGTAEKAGKKIDNAVDKVEKKAE